MNKKILVLALFVVSAIAFFAFTYSASPDMYKVIKVTGTIVYKKNSKTMIQGDVFPETEQIVFKSSDSKASIVSTARGRFILAPGSENKTGIKDNLLPPSSNVSSRSGALINSMDLKNYFKGNFVVLEAMRLKVSPAKYPLSDNSFFFLKVNYNKEVINKKLSNDSNFVVFNRAEILKVDGKPVTSLDNNAVQLCYKAKDGSVQEVADFNLFLPDVTEIVNELKLLKSEMAIQDENKLINEVTSYLSDFYGKSNRENVASFLKKHLN